MFPASEGHSTLQRRCISMEVQQDIQVGLSCRCMGEQSVGGQILGGGLNEPQKKNDEKWKKVKIQKGETKHEKVDTFQKTQKN